MLHERASEYKQEQLPERLLRHHGIDPERCLAKLTAVIGFNDDHLPECVGGGNVFSIDLPAHLQPLLRPHQVIDHFHHDCAQITHALLLSAQLCTKNKWFGGVSQWRTA